ncbi:MAG: PQQ-dependent sugar dehydrogenase [Methyloceanibacter sp.]|nr:PQQ-dependent sugar dehydrogenase [Methyloceanibacter sp.]
MREQRLLKHRLGRIRDVRIDASGVLYVLTDGGEGTLYRVELPHGEMRDSGKSPLIKVASDRRCGEQQPAYAEA